jgi:GrpB-like predicted nucleotidyltransferase (UPF0157 family)
MLGLQRGTVQVVAYHPDWHDLFEQERHILQQHIGHLILDIQHVGSTAVPGLDAKPILDIAVAVTSMAVIPQSIPLLCRIDYIDRGDGGTNGGYLFVKESAPNVRTHHVHVVAIDDPQWPNYLRFRDMLRADERLCTRYAKLKQNLQQQFSQDRQSYTAAKHAFIRGVLRQSPNV